MQRKRTAAKHNIERWAMTCMFLMSKVGVRTGEAAALAIDQVAPGVLLHIVKLNARKYWY